MPVAAGDDDHRIIGRELHAADGVFKAVADHLLGQREAGTVGKIRPVVRHDDGEAALGRKFHHMQRDMPAAQHQQPLLRQHRLGDPQSVLRPFRRHRGDHAPLEILPGGDGGEPAGKVLCDAPALPADPGFQRNGLAGFELFQNILIDVHRKHLRGGICFFCLYHIAPGVSAQVFLCATFSLRRDIRAEPGLRCCCSVEKGIVSLGLPSGQLFIHIRDVFISPNFKLIKYLFKLSANLAQLIFDFRWDF